MTVSETDAVAADRRRARRSWLPIALAVLALAAVVGFASLRPGPGSDALVLVSKAGWTADADPTTSRVTVTFVLRNAEDSPVTLTRIGRSGPGVRLVRSRAQRLASPYAPQPEGGRALPVVAAPHSAVSVSLEYAVSRCHGLDGERWPIPVTYHVGSSTGAELIDLRTATGDDWHVRLARGMCAR